MSITQIFLASTSTLDNLEIIVKAIALVIILIIFIFIKLYSDKVRDRDEKLNHK